MPLIVDGVTIPQVKGNIVVDGVQIEKVVCDGVTVWEAPSYQKYTLTISQGAYTNLTVRCVQSPSGLTTVGVNLYNGATIYAGDVIGVACTVASGYELTSNPAGTYTVSGNLTIKSVAQREKSWNLLWSGYVDNFADWAGDGYPSGLITYYADLVAAASPGVNPPIFSCNADAFLVDSGMSELDSLNIYYDDVPFGRIGNMPWDIYFNEGYSGYLDIWDTNGSLQAEMSADFDPRSDRAVLIDVLQVYSWE